MHSAYITGYRTLDSPGITSAGLHQLHLRTHVRTEHTVESPLYFAYKRQDLQQLCNAHQRIRPNRLLVLVLRQRHLVLAAAAFISKERTCWLMSSQHTASSATYNTVGRHQLHLHRSQTGKVGGGRSYLTPGAGRTRNPIQERCRTRYRKAEHMSGSERWAASFNCYTPGSTAMDAAWIPTQLLNNRVTGTIPGSAEAT